MNKQILLLIAGCIACTLFVLSIVLAVLYMTQKPECENDGETKLTEVCTKSEDTFRFLTGTDDSDDCKKGKYFYDGACHDVSKSSKEASDARATALATEAAWQMWPGDPKEECNNTGCNCEQMQSQFQACTDSSYEHYETVKNKCPLTCEKHKTS